MVAVARAPRGAFVLIGFMGAGKSTVAAELAEALGVAPRDSDELLEARLGRSLADAFDDEGGFRAEEEELVCELLAHATPGAVISLGGGSVLSERVREALKEHVVVLLDVDAEEAWSRVRAQDGGAERPLARDRERFLALHAERLALYGSLADAHLPALAPGAVRATFSALRALALAPAGTRLVWAASASGDYPVLIRRGLLSRAGLEELSRAAGLDGSRAFCVSDETVAELYARRLDVAGMLALAPGERSKTLASAESVWEALLDAGITRSD
ncbi:MAG TPA: shikimate kinase, partial [Solirubrobacteraceae bacterium]|nr:shikimate kinase [Solirubrobacteraceae bacterium]